MVAVRHLVVLCGVLLLTAGVRGGPPQAPRPPQAPPVAEVAPPSHLPDYTTAYHAAVREGKPLVVHIGYTCDRALHGLPEALHCSATVREVHVPGGRGIVVLRYYEGHLYRVGDYADDADVTVVRRALFPRIAAARAERGMPMRQSFRVFSRGRSGGSC